jgi:hypothetical protein
LREFIETYSQSLASKLKLSEKGRERGFLTDTFKTRLFIYLFKPIRG